MPKQVEMRVVVAERNGGLRKGDQVTLPRGITGLIEMLETKQSYQHVTLVGGAKGRFPIGSEVNVWRTVPTEDEEIAKGLLKITEKLSQSWEFSATQLSSSLKRLNDKYQEGQEKGYINSFDLELAVTIRKHEMEHALWNEVRLRMVDVADRPDTPAGGAALRAIMGIKEMVERELLTRTFRATSRSTSVVANLEDDLMREVKLYWLDDLKYWGCDELWEKIGTVL